MESVSPNTASFSHLTAADLLLKPLQIDAIHAEMYPDLTDP